MHANDGYNSQHWLILDGLEVITRMKVLEITLGYQNIAYYITLFQFTIKLHDMLNKHIKDHSGGN